MALPTFDEAAIRDLANPNSYYRGEEYFASGAVRSLSSQDDRYQARVQGTHLYRARIWAVAGRLQTSCTCPYDWGGICKHLVAAMLAIIETHQAGREIPQFAPAPLVPEIPEEYKVRGFYGESQRAIARLIWAILTRQGGTMEAAAITEAIA